MEENVKVKKIKLPSTMMTSVLWSVVGLILLFFPGQSLDLICKLLGIITLVAGIVMIIMGIVSGATLTGRTSLGSGIVVAVLGLFVAMRPDLLVSVLPFVAGIIMILHGVSSLVNSCQLIGAKDKYWWVGILLSVLTVLFGIILFTRSHEAAAFTARIIGIFMLYGGISHLWIGYRKSKAAKYKKQEEDALDVDAKITDAE